MNLKNEMIILSMQKKINKKKLIKRNDVKELINNISQNNVNIEDHFVNISHNTFFDFLYLIDSTILSILTKTSIPISLQDKLMEFLDYLEDLFEKTTFELMILENEIEEIDASIDKEMDYHKFSKKIKKIKREIEKNIVRINHSLALVWKTNNDKLIKICCHQKTCWEKYLKYIIGDEKKNKQSASGLYARLEAKLNS